MFSCAGKSPHAPAAAGPACPITLLKYNALRFYPAGCRRRGGGGAGDCAARGGRKGTVLARYAGDGCSGKGNAWREEQEWVA